MSKVKSKDSKIEVDFRKAIWREGFRYRKNSTKYFGKPDIVLPKHKTVIFIDSCFWHGCKKHCRIPIVRRKYWEAKIDKNIKRDKEVSIYYKRRGWEIFRIWEHDLLKKRDETIKFVIAEILKIRENQKENLPPKKNLKSSFSSPLQGEAGGKGVRGNSACRAR